MLSAVYVLCGRRPAIHDAFNRLLPPRDLSQLEDGSLVFYEENQCVVRWAIRADDLNGEDPAVVQYQDEERLEWFPDTPALSQFLFKQLYWNLVNGGMRHCGGATAPSKVISKLREVWQCANQDKDVTILLKEGCIVCLLGEARFPSLVVVGARSDQDVRVLKDAGLRLAFE